MADNTDIADAARLADEALTLCSAGEYQRAFDLARSALSHPHLVVLDKAYMHVILTLDAAENEQIQGQAAYRYFWNLCHEHNVVPNALKFYYDAMRMVRRGMEYPSELESAPAHNNFVPTDPSLFDPSFSDTHSSANNGIRAQPSLTREDLQTLLQKTMAQDTDTSPTANTQSSEMKEESSVVYTAEERKEITEKARAAVVSIFADDHAGSAMINNTFFPDSLYEDTGNGDKQSHGVTSPRVIDTQYNMTSQGLPVPYATNSRHRIVDNMEVIDDDPFTASQSYIKNRNNNAPSYWLDDSQPNSASPINAEAYGYDTAFHRANSSRSLHEHGISIGNQPSAMAQALSVLQRGQTSQGFTSFQQNLPSNSFAEHNRQNSRPQLVARRGGSDSRSFVPSSSHSFNEHEIIDPALQPSISGGTAPTHAGTVYQRFARTHGIPTSHGINQPLADFNQFTISQPFSGNRLLEGYETSNTNPHYEGNQSSGMTQSYSTHHDSEVTPEATMAHSTTAINQETIKSTITWAEKKQRDMDVAMEQFRAKRRKIIDRFYDGDYRQSSYHDQGPALGVVLPQTSGEAGTEGSEARDMEADDTQSDTREAGDIETGGMETDRHSDQWRGN